MLSVMTWSVPAADLSLATDTGSAAAAQAREWQDALDPNSSVLRARRSRANPSNRRASDEHGSVGSSVRASYLTSHECIVESDSAMGPDASLLAVLSQLPTPAPEQPSSTQVSHPMPPSPLAPIPAVAPLPGADAIRVDALAGADSTPPSPLQQPGANLSKLDIRLPGPQSAVRFTHPKLTSAAALVVDQQEGNLLFAKNPDAVRSIASITKLMTAMVALDSGLPLDERLTVQSTDVRIAKGKESRLKVGVSLTRREMLKLALMSSENRAAAALARTYPGGLPAFVDAMNRKADTLGMTETRFLEPTGLDAGNVSTAHDLALMANAAYGYPLIREFTTSDLHEVPTPDRRHRPVVTYHNSNRLVRDSGWDVGLSKTGYIGKAGRCLVMQATIAAKPVIIVLLDSLGKVARAADANRIKHWLEGPALVTPATSPRPKPPM